MRYAGAFYVVKQNIPYSTKFYFGTGETITLFWVKIIRQDLVTNLANKFSQVL
ncbi:MAG: hypothetical protein WBA93_13985 [Microcoleaceae cyanobacterium]